MKSFSSVIFLLFALLLLTSLVSATTGPQPAKKRSLTKRDACYYNNTFTNACESKQTWQARNAFVNEDSWEFLDALYHTLYLNSVPHIDDYSRDIVNGVYFSSGLCPSNANYTMKMFLINGHVFLGFWPQNTNCHGYVVDSRMLINQGSVTFPFFRPCYHNSSGTGLASVTDTITIATNINIETTVRATLAAMITNNQFFSSTKYDLLDNNCGRVAISLILSTGQYLSIAMKQFVVDRMIQNSVLNEQFSHATNLLSMWPELTTTERANLSNHSKSKKAYNYQQNKFQTNPSCDFSVVSSVTRSCLDSSIAGPVFTGSTPEVSGAGYTTNGTYCEFYWQDITTLSSTCGSITRKFWTIDLNGGYINKTQTVVVDCPYCVIANPAVYYEITENHATIRTGDTPSSTGCVGSLSHSDASLSTPCGTFSRTWNGVDACGRTTTSTSTTSVQTVHVVDSTSPGLICPDTEVACPTPTVTHECGTTAISITNSLVRTRYAITNLCGEEVIVDCENVCEAL